MPMEQVYVRESNSEVLVLIDRNMGDRLNALREAGKIIQREVLREESDPNRSIHRQHGSDIV